MFPGEGEDAEDLPDAVRTALGVDVLTHRPDLSAGGGGTPQESDGRGRRARRPVGVVDPMPAPRGAQMLAQQLAGLRREEPHVQVVPLHLHALPDPAGWCAVVRGLDFNAAIEMHRARAKAVVPRWFKRQRPEGGAFLGKHLGDLAFRGAVDPRVSPVGLPPVEVGLCGFERLEAEPFERRLLRVADASLDLALAIGVAHATRQRDHAVVCQRRDRGD